MMQNLKRNWLAASKLTKRIGQILTRALESLKNLDFNCLLLNKLYNVSIKKVQRNYVSWHWRVMKNLKKSWLVVWKMTWGIWQIFIRALESLRLWWDPFIQSRKCVSLKFTDKLPIMTMKNFVKFDEKLTCHFYIDITIWRMFPRIIKCFKNLHFSRLLLTKVYNIWTKKVQKSYVWWHWRLMQNLKKNWLVLSKMTWGI